MNIIQHTLLITWFLATFSISSAVSANADLLWPIDCKPGDDSCFSTLGYPDADADGIAHDCGAPGYLGHEGTDISVYPSAVESGVDVLAADGGEVLFVFDGHDDDCPSSSPDCQAPPAGWSEAGQSNGYRRCTAVGPYCRDGSYGCYWCFDGGNLVVLRHPDNDSAFATRYDHLKKNSITVQPGDVVGRGEKLGEVASAGASTGPHLHFEVWGDTYYDVVEPWAGSCGPNTDDSLWEGTPPWENNSPPDEVSTFLSPGNVINDTTPTYEWSAVTDSTWYQLWVNDASGNVINRWYTESMLNCESGGTCSIEPSETLTEGNVDWWVRTWNMHGYGAWSVAQTFNVSTITDPPGTVTTFYSPSAGETTSLTPMYSWAPVVGASWYFLWVNDSTGNVIQKWFTAKSLQCETNLCEAPATSLAPGNVTWWVRTWNVYGYGSWSDAQSFFAE